MTLEDELTNLEFEVEDLADFLGNTDYQDFYNKARSIRQELVDLRNEYGVELVSES